MNRIKVFFACAMLSMAFGTAVLAQDHRHTQRNDSVEEEMLATAAETVQSEPEFDIFDNKSMEEFINNTVEESLDLALKQSGDRPGVLSKAVDEGIAVAIIAVLGVFFGPVILVAIILFFIYKRKKQRDQVVIAAINKGVDIPAGYGGSYSCTSTSSNASYDAPRSGKNNITEDPMMHKGIKNVSIGLGLVVLAMYLHVHILVGIGWMVVIYGAGKIAIAYLSGNKTISKEEPKYTRTVEKVQEDEKSE